MHYLLHLLSEWVLPKGESGNMKLWHGAVVLRHDYFFLKRCFSAIFFLRANKYYNEAINTGVDCIKINTDRAL